MSYQEFDVNRAKGIRLFEPLRFDGLVLPKGHILTDEDIIQLKLSGIKKIFGAAMAENDLDRPTALGILSAKLCGENTAFTTGEDGISRIVAAKGGLFVCSDDRIAKFNRLSPLMFINTVPPYAQVKAGEVIARLELTVPVIAQSLVDELVFSLSGNTELLSVAVPEVKKTALLYSRFYNDKTETKHFTSVVKKLVKNFSAHELEFQREYDTRHSIEEVADGVERALKDDNDVVFVLAGQRSNSPQDVVPAAVRSIADEIVCQTIPVVGASDLLIATKRGKRIIVLPYEYDMTEAELCEHYIKLALVNDKIAPFDFARPQNVLINSGQFLSEAEQSVLVKPQDTQNGDKLNIAAIILAAGIGRRAGRNKLLADINGEPLFLRAVRAAVNSKARPVFVITGYHAEEVEAALEDIDVNIIYNPAYHSGIRTSIELGLKSVPNFCRGAILIPADMPNLTPEFINKMLDEFNETEEKQLVTASLNGIKTNPVLWSKALYAEAGLVPENADLRPVFLAHSDYTTQVEEDADILLDVNYPYDLDQLNK